MIGVVDTAPYIAGALGAGGLGAFVSRRGELIRRWCTWALTAPIVGGALLFGARGAAALGALLAVVAVAEFGRMARLSMADRWVGATGLVAVTAVAAFAPQHVVKVWVAGAAAVVLLPVVNGDAVDGARRAAYGVLGFCWLSGLAGLVVLHGLALPLFFAVSVADVAAWGFGRAIRSPRLSPLSPNKGFSGLIGGAIAGVAVLALLGALSAVTALAVAVGGPLGDLFESMIKRGAGVKDAGAWLPGFGGLLDRIDSVLAAFAIVLVLS